MYIYVCNLKAATFHRRGKFGEKKPSQWRSITTDIYLDTILD
jgi:hypothetical protein